MEDEYFSMQEDFGEYCAEPDASFQATDVDQNVTER